MKKFLPFLFSILLFACNNEQDRQENLKSLYHKRDSLRELFNSVSVQLRDLENTLAQLDTSIQQRSILVSTQQIEPKKFEHFIEIHGVVESEKNAVINAETSGIIKSIRVNKGQKVEKGQVLVVLDADLIQKNIEEVETAYELANTLFQRQEKLWKQNIGSEIQYLEAKNRKQSLEQKLTTLRAQRDMAIVKAPFSGIVDEIFPKEGEMASPMAPLLRIINGEKFYVTADVPEGYLNSIKTGNEVHAKFPSINKEIRSKIDRVGQFINPSNRTFKIQINLDNSAGELRPNLLSVMMVKTFESDSAIVVPSGAIQQDASGVEYVFVVQRNSPATFAKRVNVKTGRSAKGATMIESGLNGTEELIIEGARGLKENEKIEIAK
jgi:membrane fusion protein, multidrug efflux system